MDPISAIGIVGSVFGVADIVARSLKGLVSLQAMYKSADLLVTIIIGYLHTVKAALTEIQDWVKSLEDPHEHAALLLEIESAIGCCAVIVETLFENIDILQRKAEDQGKLTPRGKLAYILGETGLKEMSTHLANQVQALNLLVTAAHCKTSRERNQVLQDVETRSVLRQIQDDSTSYVQTGSEVASILTRRSITTEHTDMLNSDFDFDTAVLDSQVYRSAFRSMLRQKELNKQDALAVQTHGGGFVRAGLSDSQDEVSTSLYESAVLTRRRRPIDTVRDPRSNHSLTRDVSGLSPNAIPRLETEVSNQIGIVVNRDFTVKSRPASPSAKFSRSVEAGSLGMDLDKPHIDITSFLVLQKQQQSYGEAVRSILSAGRLGICGDVNLTSVAYSAGQAEKEVTRRKRGITLLSKLRPTSPQPAAGVAGPGTAQGNDSKVLLLHSRLGDDSKILLLGASDSGKSTLLKACKVFYEGALSVEERYSFKKIIYTNMIQSIYAVLEGMDYLEILLGRADSEIHKHIIFDQPRPFEGDNIPAELANAIYKLREDSGVQQSLVRSGEYQLDDAAPYWFSNVTRICHTNYLPSEEDILRSRVRTAGITETTFDIDGHICRVFDTSGTRAGRKQWVHAYGDVASTLFTVDISNYDQLLYEDETMNRMQEQLRLFDDVVNSRWLKNAEIVVLFTKTDRLREKLPKSPLRNRFPDYKGSTFEEAKQYFLNRFVSLNRNPAKVVYTHFGSFVEGESPAMILRAIKDIIIAKRQDESRPVWLELRSQDS